ncbi:MAG: YtxH domain-containing protein [Solibacillus sp.]|jgi:gas vesicle protein|uniref:YtxH domain-containing protein n=1 Tax=unclassified Solibacillus TaxID=2637870 RepID=UPI0030F6303F
MTEKPVTYQTPQDYTKINDAIYGEETVHVKDFVIGAFVGGIVGAAVALLLAPKAGSELRNDVAVQAVTLKEQSSTLVEKVKAKTAKQPPAMDDGTVSSEGEEPLEDAVEEVLKDLTESMNDKEEKVELANSTRHSSIE